MSKARRVRSELELELIHSRLPVLGQYPKWLVCLQELTALDIVLLSFVFVVLRQESWNYKGTFFRSHMALAMVFDTGALFTLLELQVLTWFTKGS